MTRRVNAYSESPASEACCRANTPNCDSAIAARTRSPSFILRTPPKSALRCNENGEELREAAREARPVTVVLGEAVVEELVEDLGVAFALELAHELTHEESALLLPRLVVFAGAVLVDGVGVGCEHAVDNGGQLAGIA